MIINLTPHPINIYPADTPDRVDPATVEPLLTIGPCLDYPTARIGEIPLGTTYIDADATVPSLSPQVPVEYVEYTSHGGLVHPLPPGDDHEPHRTWFVVGLVVALSQTYINHTRSDLLVPYREVRNLAGTVIGCRQLARPV